MTNNTLLFIIQKKQLQISREKIDNSLENKQNI